MNFSPTKLDGVVCVDPFVYEDERGYFMDTWQQEEFNRAGIDAEFVQHSVSSSGAGAVRGLHYQIRQPQGKLIRVIRGEVYDVALDLRRSSPCFGQWVGEVLSDGNRRQLWIPPGFAHGFLVMSELAEVEYRLTEFYAPEHERTVRWDDPDLGIEWPLADGQRPILSDKDRAGIAFSAAEYYA